MSFEPIQKLLGLRLVSQERVQELEDMVEGVRSGIDYGATAKLLCNLGKKVEDMSEESKASLAGISDAARSESEARLAASTLIGSTLRRIRELKID